MKIPILFLILFQLVFTFDLTINDETISDPINYVKSTFHQYIPTPKLQEKLEIPIVKPMQKTIRESFIQERPPRPKKFGIRSYFRDKLEEKRDKSDKLDKVASMSVDPEVAEVAEDAEEIQEKQVELLNSIAPIHSFKSWVKEFLLFKQNQKVSINSVGRNSLHTKIKNYDNTASNPYDLKRWVQLVSSEDDGESVNGITKKYSNLNPSTNKNNNEIELDIDEFIKYLVNEQGFNPSDLQFLRTKNLDYGLGEIERELNKVKDQRRSPKVIQIGGEEENAATKPNIHSIFIVLLVIVLFG